MARGKSLKIFMMDGDVAGRWICTLANLKNMRQFYLTFSNGYALRSELSWTHYRLLMRVENENARDFYMQEYESDLEQALMTHFVGI